MTLHQAISEALLIFDNSATTKEIADYINKTSIYQRGDGNTLTPSQINARVGSYPKLFLIDENNIVTGTLDGEDLATRLPNGILNLITAHYAFDSIMSLDLNIMVCSLLVYFRQKKHSQLFSQFLNSIFLEKGEIELILKSTEEYPKVEYNRILEIISSSHIDLLSNSQFKKLVRNWLILFEKTNLNRGLFSTPAKVNNIIASLLTKEKNYFRVLDPFAGACSSICFLNDALDENTNYDIQDINSNTALLGKLNLIANGVKKFTVTTADSTLADFKYGYDLITTTTPFGVELNLRHFSAGIKNSSNKDFGYRIPIECDIIRKTVNSLSHDGQAIIIVPESFLFSSRQSVKGLRKNLIEQGLIEQVISMPSGAFQLYSAIKASILVLNKVGTSFRRVIKFSEITKNDLDLIPEHFAPEQVFLTNSLSVNIQNIENLNYDLTADRYIKSFDVENHLGPDKIIVTLGSIVSIVNTRGDIDKNLINSSDGIPLVRPVNLSSSSQSPFLEIADTMFVEDSSETRLMYKRKFIPENSILVSRIGTKLKPCVYNDSKPVLSSGNIFCLAVNQDIAIPLFLATELREEYVTKQLELVRPTTGGIPSVNTSNLLGIKVWLPSLQDQLNVVNRRLSNTIVEDNNARNIISGETSNNIIAIFKHEFVNLKNPLLSGIKNLEMFLEERIDLEVEKPSERPGSGNVRQLIDRIKYNAEEMAGIMDDMVEVLSLRKKTKEVNIIDFFLSLDQKINLCKESVFIDSSVGKLDSFTIDSSLICKAFRNLVINAEKHGYVNAIKERNIFFKISKSEQNQSLVIDFINDGVPFADGFTFKDYVSFGKKSGEKSGSGIGGYLIDRIVSIHDGTFNEVDLINSNRIEQLGTKEIIKGIHFRIKLPIYND